MRCVKCDHPLTGSRSRTAEARRHRGRGLCGHCYRVAQYAGTLEDYPTLRRSSADVLEDWEELRSQGYTIQHAAGRLGMSEAALRKAISRARVAA